MLVFSETVIERVVVHHVGNKNRSEGIKLSAGQFQANDEALNEALTQFFLYPFDTEETYSFFHEVSLEENRIFGIATQIFDHPDDLHKQSVLLAQHLYECSDHPKIASGDLYVAILKNCIAEDEVVDALGIFKAETRDMFLRLSEEGGIFRPNCQTGNNIKHLDKGCLIFNTEKGNGYKVAMIDRSGKGNDAQYWRDVFLKIRQRNTDFYQTAQYMNLCKGFVKEVYNEDNQIEKADQADMLNRTLNYFKEREAFDRNEFEQEVMQGDQAIIGAFNQYKDLFAQENEVVFEDSFDVSKQATKQGGRQFKSVLKLDKNFHIYIHGDRNRIEKGFDETTGLHYYKVYFEKEL